MSHSKTIPVKNSNPMHSSLLFAGYQNNSILVEDDKYSQLSPFCTKATISQVEDVEHQEHVILRQNYQNRIKHLQLGFQRSKVQFENSLKSVYKEKIVLLNIISHNQILIDEFRNKLKLTNDSTFKEIETKYNIITNGIFHSQLCPDCILRISKANFQTKTHEKGKEIIKKSEFNSNKDKTLQMKLVPQYSWMYQPHEQILAISKLKTQNIKLKSLVDNLIQQHLRKINQKNRQIELIKNQINKTFMVPIKTSIHTIGEVDNQKLIRYKEKIKQLEEKVDQCLVKRGKSDKLIRELNERVMSFELQKLNMKYRSKYF